MTKNFHTFNCERSSTDVTKRKLRSQSHSSSNKLCLEQWDNGVQPYGTHPVQGCNQ